MAVGPPPTNPQARRAATAQLLAISVWLEANELIDAAAIWLAAAVCLKASGIAIAAATTPAITTIRVNLITSFASCLSELDSLLPRACEAKNCD